MSVDFAGDINSATPRERLRSHVRYACGSRIRASIVMVEPTLGLLPVFQEKKA